MADDGVHVTPWAKALNRQQSDKEFRAEQLNRYVVVPDARQQAEAQLDEAELNKARRNTRARVRQYVAHTRQAGEGDWRIVDQIRMAEEQRETLPRGNDGGEDWHERQHRQQVEKRLESRGIVIGAAAKEWEDRTDGEQQRRRTVRPPLK
jgi:hypothetical protein